MFRKCECEWTRVGTLLRSGCRKETFLTNKAKKAPFRYCPYCRRRIVINEGSAPKEVG